VGLKKSALVLLLGLCVSAWPRPVYARPSPPTTCARPQPGSIVQEPPDLRSHNGVLKVDLTVHDALDPDGSTRYCYTDAEGHESPNLRLHPGDLLILNLKNDLTDLDAGHRSAKPVDRHMNMNAPGENNCTGGMMTSISTNLHFHGLTIPAIRPLSFG